MRTYKTKKPPKCDLCSRPAHYHSKTITGKWVKLCESCFYTVGTGLGPGRGEALKK